MRQYLLGCLGVVLALCVIGGTGAKAQSEQGVQIGPLEAVDVGNALQRVDLLLGKARILRLPTDVRDVLVADPAIADVVVRTPRLVYVLGRGVGDTNVFFFDDKGAEIVRLDARVDLDLSALRAALKAFLPDEDIRVASVNENIILTGTVSSAPAADDARALALRFVEEESNIILMLDVEADQQVVLRVRIAEMARTAVKRLGINLGLSVRTGSSIQSFGMDALPPGPNLGTVGLVSALDAMPLLAETFSATALLAGGINRFRYAIDALESNGLVKTLAEPNLTALSGETANFQAGGEFPVPTGAVFTASFQFKPFGIALDFTPVVLSSGRISLRVRTEVSDIDFDASALGVPGVSTRRASTTVELPSGGSLVIAGLLQDNIDETIQGVPGVMDLPILGALFRSVAFQRNETELIIAVTVHLVRPVDEHEITLPTDGFAPASDLDMYLFGRLHATYAKSEMLPSLSELKAPTGYIME